MNPPGWRRNPSAPPADPVLLEALRGLATSLLSDNMARASGTIGLVPYHRPRPMAGTAVTVCTRGGDNLAIHRAFDFCRPGDVQVIDGGGKISMPVAVGGMVVHPGHLVVGGDDGVLAIAPEGVAAAMETARHQGEKEAAVLQSIAEGRFDHTWVGPHEAKMMDN